MLHCRHTKLCCFYSRHISVPLKLYLVNTGITQTYYTDLGFTLALHRSYTNVTLASRFRTLTSYRFYTDFTRAFHRRYTFRRSFNITCKIQHESNTWTQNTIVTISHRLQNTTCNTRNTGMNCKDFLSVEAQT